jgi:Spy/CpxP family protein refolding chaperone
MKRISIATLAILILMTATAFAQGRPPGGPGPVPGGPGPNNSALAEYLALTTAQKASWETIQSEFRASAETLHTQERALAEQLKTALDGTDATAIGTLMLQIRAIHEQIGAAKEAADAKFAALLTAEQKVKFAAFQAAVEFLQQHGPGAGPGGPR